jgi:hypothetical protein
MKPAGGEIARDAKVLPEKLREKAVKTLLESSLGGRPPSIVGATGRQPTMYDKSDTAPRHDLAPKRLTIVRGAITHGRGAANFRFTRAGIGRFSGGRRSTSTGAGAIQVKHPSVSRRERVIAVSLAKILNILAENAMTSARIDMRPGETEIGRGEPASERGSIEIFVARISCGEASTTMKRAFMGTKGGVIEAPHTFLEIGDAPSANPREPSSSERCLLEMKMHFL